MTDDDATTFSVQRCIGTSGVEGRDEHKAHPSSAGVYGCDAPSRRSLARLRADPSLAEGFAEVAIVAMIPAGMGDVHPGHGLDGGLMAEVDEAAAAREKPSAGR